jgi:alpha-mannosidase
LLSARDVAASPAATTLAENVDDAFVHDAEIDRQALRSKVEELVKGAAERLSSLLARGAGGEPGLMILNPLSFTRLVVPPDASAPGMPVKVPGCGFHWVPESGKTPSKAKVPLAEENVLRNDVFECIVSTATGGIQRLKNHGRSPNRLSQQLGFRFPRERTITRGEGEDRQVEQTYYSEMRCRSLEVVSDGPVLGEIVTTGDVVDQQNETRLAGFRQRFRVWRHRPVLEVQIELDLERTPEGDPWSNYYGCRFAYNDVTAALTRSVLAGAHGFQGQRIESPHYLEIASEETRTTIVSGGLPFYRKTGDRLVDALLAVAGEERRSFTFWVVMDTPFPLEAALDALSPAIVVPGVPGPPPAGTAGWLLNVNPRNVQLTAIMPLRPNPESDASEGQDENDVGPGFGVRLVETEGRHRTVRLHAFRAPRKARQRDFRGETVAELRIEDEAVLVDMTAYEIADVELWF